MKLDFIKAKRFYISNKNDVKAPEIFNYGGATEPC